MAINREAEVFFPNLRSRVLFGRQFKRQFILPEPPPPAVERFLKWYERSVMDVDISGIQIDRPIFLIGLPRSGTTMLQDLICTHPRIAYLSHVAHRFRTCFCAAEMLRKQLTLEARGERYLGDSVEVSGGSASDGNAFWGQWFREDPSTLRYVERRLKHYSAGEIEELRHAIRRILWCSGRLPHRFFAKNPGFLPYIDLLSELFPDARFIHIVRDPRMTANSLLKLYHLEQEQLAWARKTKAHGLLKNEAFVPYPRLPNVAGYAKEFGPDDIRTTAHLWHDAVEWVHARRASLPSFFEVRYEDIVSEPQPVLARIFDFCELDPMGQDNAAFHKKLGEVGVVRHSNRYGAFEVIEAICHAPMKRYGY